MKKEYAKPTAEKINFDYVESVVACPSGCGDPSHWDHLGYYYGSCGMSAGNQGGGTQGGNGGTEGGNGGTQGGTQSNQGSDYWTCTGSSYWNP